MMTDLLNAKIQSLQNNIARYCRLLATDLIELERDYIHWRIAQERADLDARLLTKRGGQGSSPEAYFAASAYIGEAWNQPP